MTFIRAQGGPLRRPSETPVVSQEQPQRSCGIFYIYGFILGLGCSVVCAIFALGGSEPTTILSKSMSVVAIFLSSLTFICQQVIACRGEKIAGQRSATIAVGLTITLVAVITTIAGTPGYKGVFFMSGAFSSVFYAFTIIAFIVSFKRDRKAHRRADEVERGWRATDVNNGMFVVGDQCNYPRLHRLSWSGDLLSYLESHYDINPQDTLSSRHLMPLSELIQLGVPSGVKLPPYSESVPPYDLITSEPTINSDRRSGIHNINMDSTTTSDTNTNTESTQNTPPPAYFDNPAIFTTGSPILPTDLPPTYLEIDQSDVASYS